MPDPTDYETRRLAKIAKNQALLAELDIKPLAPPERKRGAQDSTGTAVAKRRKALKDTVTAPSRTSARIASAPAKPNYTDDVDIKAVALPRSAGRTSSKGGKGKLGSVVKQEIESEPLAPTKDVDAIRTGWTDWEPAAPEPVRDAQGVFRFEGWEAFAPNKSPEEMLREGVFGGSYFRPLRSKKLGIVVEGDWQELPESWNSGLSVERYLTNPNYDAEINKFHVSCGQSIEEWEAAGWISHEHDVRGWFQWYCRFFLGRRCEDDERQVSRWKKCVGETGRWRRVLMKQYGRAGVRQVQDDGESDPEEEEDGQKKGISPVVSQTCFHWGFEVRQPDLDRWWEEGT